jgi:branched-chain amino acid transport system permease protein
MRPQFAIPPLVVLVAVLAAAPWFASDYGLSLMVNLMSYVVLVIAWALFSGTTRLVSLATSAFYGIGMYTVAVLVKDLPLEAIFAIAGLIGAGVALIVGVLTLRISGMFFVIFGFGLSEMIRQVMIWWEINKTHTMGRYVFVDFDTTMIYEHLLALAVIVFLVGWWLRRSRLGIALLVIGDDETMARQAGINVPVSKVTMFVISSVFMTLTGAVMAPRFGFINPNVAFTPLISFQVVIMALLGGLQRLWGPVLGIVPLVMVSEFLQIQYPFWFSVLLGLIFMVIVYFVPEGLTGLLIDAWERLGRPMNLPQGLIGPLRDGLAWLARPLRAAYDWLARPRSLPRGIAGAIEDAWYSVAGRPPEKKR